MKAFFVLALSILISATALAAPAPQFTTVDINGKTHSLADYKGKTVVLEWFNPGCPFVKKHYESGNMQKLQEKYTKQGVVWLTVNSSALGKQGYMTHEEAKEKVSQWHIKASASLVDADGIVGKMYGAKTTPHMFVIDPKGELVYQGAIDDNSSSSQASIENAKNFVQATLDEILAGKMVTVASTDPYGCSVKYAG